VKSFLPLAVVLLATSAAPAAAQDSTSASFRIQGLAISATNTPSSSTHFRISGSAANAATVTPSASASFVSQPGFWGWIGNGVVPLILATSKPSSTKIALDWTGNDPPFRVYRSTDCSDPLQSEIAWTSDHQVVDRPPPLAPLVCYTVYASAPGSLGLAPPDDGFAPSPTGVVQKPRSR